MGTTMQETPQTDGQRKLRYIELFAGVGGFALALNRLGHVCVWANEWDKYANSNIEEGDEFYFIGKRKVCMSCHEKVLNYLEKQIELL